MKIKTFHIRLSKEHLLNDENVMNEFLDDKQIINTFADLVKAEKINYWSVVVAYTEKNEFPKNDALLPELLAEKPVAYNDSELSESELFIYNKLKDWRSRQAQTEGISYFLIAHNRELIAIAKHNIQNITELKSINGFGEKKIAKYGMAIVELLKSL